MSRRRTIARIARKLPKIEYLEILKEIEKYLDKEVDFLNGQIQ